MSTRQDHRIEPSQLSPDVLRQLEQLVRSRQPVTLVGPSGERVELPGALNDLIVFVVESMRRRKAVFVAPEDAALTTQAAAQFLGMSRPYLLRLLDAGKLPFHRVGTHRRVRLDDLLAYRLGRDEERRRRLDALASAVDAAGVYDRS